MRALHPSSTMTNGSNMTNLKHVQDHYSEVAAEALTFADGCESCDAAPISAYTKSEAEQLYGQDVLAGIPLGALAASRGCGDPVARALLQPGETVLDLGSGGGIDAIIAARLVGSQGHVFGLDMTPDMVELARQNAQLAACDNVEFLEGNIENIPLADESVNVVISNCVINFCENKRRVMEEAFRVLKPGGRFVVSDIVALGDLGGLSPVTCEALCKLVGCTNGMSSINEYRQLLGQIGFAESQVDPKTVYTEAVLAEKAQRKGREALYATITGTGVDAVSGSAIVFAFK